VLNYEFLIINYEYLSLDMGGENILKQRSFRFSLKIIEVYKFLTLEQKEFVLSKQLIRSGTSVGANIREAQNAQSKNDFIHKLSISQKECDEALYWLELLHQSGYINSELFAETHKEADEILKMLKSAIVTSKNGVKKVISNKSYIMPSANASHTPNS
jgi:four helix bundle protein